MPQGLPFPNGAIAQGGICFFHGVRVAPLSCRLQEFRKSVIPMKRQEPQEALKV
jgi:hypothetical protein